MNTINPKDRQILSQLAERVAALAARDSEKTKRDLWYRHNALETTRPVIFCDPENGWNEIVTPDQLHCESELARAWEFGLRKEIFWGERMGDDRVVEPFFSVPYVFTETDWGVHQTQIGGADGGAYTWESPIKSYDDFDKLSFPEITVDHQATQDLLALAQEVVGEHLTVQLKYAWWWSLGMTYPLALLRGLEEMMFDMFDKPADLHRLMAFLRDGHIKKIEFLESNGLLSLNNDGTYVGSGGFGYTNELPQTDFDGRVRANDMWGFCESQETVGVSPEMFEEVVFQYQLPILERFGLNCYGCCEPLDKRWHVVKRTPRLRRVSVSAWADWSVMAGYLGDRYIYSMKPNPADLSLPELDQDRIRKDMRAAMDITGGCHLEVIMKDVHTLGRNPENAINWCRIAREEAERTG
jgi:hypothetical protein